MEPAGPERLFSLYRSRVEAGRDVDFEAWVRSHSEHEAELRRLHDEWRARGLRARDPAESSCFWRSGARSGTPQPDLHAGRVVGDFELVSFIAKGGMGEVWEARQASLGGRRVAVKFVRPDRVSPRQLDLFRREARAGGRLSHPGLVSLHGYGESDGQSWIAMEYVEGCWTLRDFLDELLGEGRVPPDYDRQVARLVAEIADAMQAAHEAGVIHRDLKPQNVLVTSDDHPKVTDFGLARITDETALSQTGEFAGTYFYMSPEQVAARRTGIDHRTDVFSLGVVLYELLTLQRPFQGDTSHQVAAQILAKDPPDPRTIRSRIPRDLVVIAGVAMEKDPDRRYQTMAELAADLRRHLADEPIVARPPSIWARAAKWARRHPTWSVAGAVALAAFAVVSLLLAQNVRANRALTRTVGERDAAIGALDHANAELEGANEALRREIRSVQRLSALQDLDELLARAKRLWPPHPETIGAYRQWIVEARRLVDELPFHRSARDELRASARGGPDGPRPDAAGPEWVFPDTESGRVARWWHANLTRLIEALEALADPETGLLSEAAQAASPEHGWSVPRRLRLAERLRAGLAPGGEFHDRWQAASAAVRAHATYGGLTLPPQTGLVPIGPDPATGLWEFWHVASGEEPERGADGALAVTDGSGLVLVLLPGGTFWMGAQPRDPAGPNHDPLAQQDETPHRVRLGAFFVSKYEMTQGQWLRCVGWNRSTQGPDGAWRADWSADAIGPTWTSPVTDVSWEECMRWLPRFGLALPSEAQWEYACRAGTDTSWWSGSEPESLVGVANLADRYARAHGGSDWVDVQEWLDDGFTAHAPAGTYRPNPFGLCEVHGNVGEWCLDGYADLAPGGPFEDPVVPWEGSLVRVSRGGCFLHTAAQARSAMRNADAPAYADYFLGVRPARAVEP